MKMDFYICNHCKNIIAYLNNSGVAVKCCGEEMQKIEPNTNEASTEKHIPQIKREGNKVTVTVGSVIHPMTAEHHIAWIALETKAGNQRKAVKINTEPKAEFYIDEKDEVVAAYTYCNLHGIWQG